MVSLVREQATGLPGARRHAGKLFVSATIRTKVIGRRNRTTFMWLGKFSENAQFLTPGRRGAGPRTIQLAGIREAFAETGEVGYDKTKPPLEPAVISSRSGGASCPANRLPIAAKGRNDAT